jgi:hypothetical protein
MNRTDAAELAVKITKTWRGGPALEVWQQDLEELHTGQAQQTYTMLRRSEDSAPSVAKFLGVYRSLTVTDGPLPKCVMCESSGWVEVEEHGPSCNRTDHCGCSAVKPCHCANGRQRESAFKTILRERATKQGEPA